MGESFDGCFAGADKGSSTGSETIISPISPDHPTIQTLLTWDSIALDSDRKPIGDAGHSIAYQGAVGGVGGGLNPPAGGRDAPPALLQSYQQNSRYPDIQPFNIPSTVKMTPGYGEAHPKCGSVRFKVLCSNDADHYTTLARETCHRPACPKCYDTWVKSAAQRAAERVTGYKQASGTSYDARHISIHPPNDLLKDVPQDKALQWLYDEIRRLSSVLKLSAYLLVPHPYRIRPEKQDEIKRALNDSTLNPHGLNRYEYALSLPTWRDYVYFSPHIHLLVYGHLLNSQDFFKFTGWTYRNHGARSGKALEGTIRYLLTHAWVLGNSKVCRYFKGMSTHLLKAEGGGYTIEPILCPVCQAACVATPVYLQSDGSWMHHFQDLNNAPVATKKVRFPAYYSLQGVKHATQRSNDSRL